jgi:hypothetical protein
MSNQRGGFAAVVVMKHGGVLVGPPGGQPEAGGRIINKNFLAIFFIVNLIELFLSLDAQFDL